LDVNKKETKQIDKNQSRQKNVEYTCQILGTLNMGNFEKGGNLPHCLRRKFLPLYTIHGVMLHC